MRTGCPTRSSGTRFPLTLRKSTTHPRSRLGLRSPTRPALPPKDADGPSSQPRRRPRPASGAPHSRPTRGADGGPGPAGSLRFRRGRPGRRPPCTPARQARLRRPRSPDAQGAPHRQGEAGRRPQLNRQPRRAERRPASGARAPRLRSRPLPRGPGPHCRGTRRGTPRCLREGGRGSWLGGPLRPLLTPSSLAYPVRPGPPHAQSSRGDSPSATIETGPEAGQNASLQASDAATEENEPGTELERLHR